MEGSLMVTTVITNYLLLSVCQTACLLTYLLTYLLGISETRSLGRWRVVGVDSITVAYIMNERKLFVMNNNDENHCSSDMLYWKRTITVGLCQWKNLRSRSIFNGIMSNKKLVAYFLDCSLYKLWCNWRGHPRRQDNRQLPISSRSLRV